MKYIYIYILLLSTYFKYNFILLYFKYADGVGSGGLADWQVYS